MEEISFFGGLIAAFAFGTLWFYTACTVTFFGIMALSENDHEIFAIVALAMFIYVMEKSGAFNIFADPVILLKWAILYFIIGVVWSFVKWTSFVYKKADEFVAARMYFLNNLGKLVANKDNNRTVGTPKLADIDVGIVTEKTKVPSELNEVFLEHIRSHGIITYSQRDSGTIRPSAIDHKSNITTWIIWWPTSALWTLVSDPMVRIVNWIFSRLKGTYQLISDKAFAKFD